MMLKVAVVSFVIIQTVVIDVVRGRNVLLRPKTVLGDPIPDRGPSPTKAAGSYYSDLTHHHHHHRHLHHTNGSSSHSKEVVYVSQGKDYTCDLCPTPHDIAPCMCQCLNESAARIVCGPGVSSCSQLTEVMSLTTYPVNTYLRLEVVDTSLGCKLEKDLWGLLVFQEIVITNNRFKVLDNRAFQPFSATLTSLNLEGNTLTDVYFSTMSDTPLLRFLKLSNNAVPYMPGYAAMHLPLLEIFDASHNQIPVVNPRTFEGMPKLRKIDLSHNSITKLYAEAFTIPGHDESSLTINLADNIISHIEPGVADGLRGCSIDLRNNRLTVLPENVFRPIIDFTAPFFWTTNNPFQCDSEFCWIATNNTVIEFFDSVLCVNLDNYPVNVLTPSCIKANQTTTTTIITTY